MRGNLSGLPAEARRSRMAILVERRGFALVADLAKLFEISEVTVRADLDALAEQQLIRRVHGGAMLVNHAASLQKSFDRTASERPHEKARIGRVAAALVESHQVVTLDAGTTSMALAKALIERDDLIDITVVTNSLNIALELEAGISRMTVIVTGGTLRPALHCLVDPLADAVLDRVRADIAFIGCNGVDAEAGITNTSLAEAEVKRRIIKNATRTVVIADSSKMGTVRASRVCGLEQIALLVSGQEADEPLVAELREAGLEVLMA